MQTIFYEQTGDHGAQKIWWDRHVAQVNLSRSLQQAKRQQSSTSPRSSISPRSQRPMIPQPQLSPRNSLSPRKRSPRNLQPIRSPRSNYPPTTNEPFYPGFLERVTGGGKNTGPEMNLKLVAPVVSKKAPVEETMSPEELARMKEEAAKAKKQGDVLKAAAEEKIYSRFKNVREAFKYIDVDNSGEISQEEFKRQLERWGVPLDDVAMTNMFAMVDTSGDGVVNYDEFVDALARETVAIDAMGKRGMQSKEAMGVSAFELLDQQLKVKKDKFAPKYRSEKQKFKDLYGEDGEDVQ